MVATMRTPPLNIEREYAKEVKAVIRDINNTINKLLVERLPEIEREVFSDRPLGPRKDAASPKLNAIFNGIKVQVAAKYTPDVMRQMAKRIGVSLSDFNRKAQKSGLKRVAGVDVFFEEPYLEEQIELFSINNANLITNLNDDVINKIQGNVLRDFMAGKRHEEIAKDIRKLVGRGGKTSRRAELIARDQVNKLNGQLTMLRQAELGVKEYIWRTSGDERVRDSHRRKEGKRYRWDDPPNDTGHPGEDINCRCTAEPVLDSIL